MDRDAFRILLTTYAATVRSRSPEEGKFERIVLSEFNSVLGTVDSMIRELKPVFRPGFVGDNPVWACGKLRDDFEDLRDQIEPLRAENERLRAELVPVPFSQRYPDDGQLILIWDAYLEKWQLGGPWKSANDGTDDTYIKMHYPFWFPVPPAPPHGA